MFPPPILWLLRRVWVAWGAKMFSDVLAAAPRLGGLWKQFYLGVRFFILHVHILQFPFFTLFNSPLTYFHFYFLFSFLIILFVRLPPFPMDGALVQPVALKPFTGSSW